ncbi:MAG: cob(I)yrinic acid a,c-diamide adenosyltransferase [Novosphingobium sp.]|nr:cob(I)yrinic acid a,c-diamide adenosyltransferase [Novosphingobium sp.]
MVKLNKIYTRTGDDGTTGLVDGSRRAKHDLRMAAIGEVDECNSAIGFAALALEGEALTDLRRIQNDLFDLGADLATPLGGIGGDDFVPSEMVLRTVAAQVTWLERAIDAANAPLAPLTSFILPGGSEAAARVHLARAISRRSERAATALAAAEPVNPQALAYLNRLSDYLFVLARAINAGGAGDVQWVPGANR